MNSISQTEDADGSESSLFAQRLAKAGYSDFYVMDRESARKVLTEKRLEILEYLKQNEVESVRELSRELDRDIKNVSDDLGVLWENALIDYEGDGRKKKPYLVSKNIFIKPVLKE
jgi:predicted transcriptional regulator